MIPVILFQTSDEDINTTQDKNQINLLMTAMTLGVTCLNRCERRIFALSCWVVVPVIFF